MRAIVYILLVFVTQYSYSGTDTTIFNDKEKGYFLKYPADWVARIYRSGVVIAHVANRKNDTGISIRLYDYNGREDYFIKRYIQSVESDLRTKLKNRDNKYIDGLAFTDLNFSPTYRGSSFEHIHRIHLFKEQNVALVMQAGCPSDTTKQRIPKLIQTMDSLWVYNKEKLRK